MKKFKSSIVSLLAISMLLSACTEPGETTGIGAATGGVIGAGLGAIVGNQTGNAGSGLVIGGVAGAGAGAAIGNSLEAQQKAVRTQDEAIERQQKMLAAQNAEIKELRNMPRDSDSALSGALHEQRRRSQSTSSTNRLNSRSSASLTDQLNSGADQTYSHAGKVSAGESRAAMKPLIIQPQTETLKAIPPASEEKISAALNECTIETDNFNQTRPAVEQADKEAQSLSALRVASPSADKGGECEKADSEAGKAASASEPADKLFYLRRAIRLCPSNAGFHKQLADEYAGLGRNEGAEASYEEALKLDPKLSEAKKGMAALSSNAY